jgi:hypothetical protein
LKPLITANSEEELVETISEVFSKLSAGDEETIALYTSEAFDKHHRRFVPRYYIADNIGEWSTVREPSEYVSGIAWVGVDAIGRNATIKIADGGGVILIVDGETRVYHGELTN